MHPKTLNVPEWRSLEPSMVNNRTQPLVHAQPLSIPVPYQPRFCDGYIYYVGRIFKTADLIFHKTNDIIWPISVCLANENGRAR